MDRIKVGMADMNITHAPNTLITLGLGSCVGIVIYDPTKKLGGMAHVMLPDSTQIRRNSNRAKFADTAIEDLVTELCQKGVEKNQLVAKIAGGAEMFQVGNSAPSMRIGYRNVIAVKAKLEGMGIKIVAEDTGKNYGRTIEMNLENGNLSVKTIGDKLKII